MALVGDPARSSSNTWVCLSAAVRQSIRMAAKTRLPEDPIFDKGDVAVIEGRLLKFLEDRQEIVERADR